MKNPLFKPRKTMECLIHTKDRNLDSHSLSICNVCVRRQTLYGAGWPDIWGLVDVGLLMSVTRNTGPIFNTKVVSLASQRSCGASCGGFEGTWTLDVPYWRHGIALPHKSYQCFNPRAAGALQDLLDDKCFPIQLGFLSEYKWAMLWLVIM